MSLTTNLISYWKLDGNSNDSVGTNNGTDTSISYSTGNGKINQGAGFNGTSSKITVASSASLNSPSSALTFSMWVKLNVTTNKIFAIKYSDGAGGGDYFMRSIAGSLACSTAGGTGAITNASGFSTGVWYHMCLTWTSGSLLTLYVNGSSVGTDNTPGTITSAAFPMDLGSYNSSQWTDCCIDEVGLWSRALSSTEVSQLYNSGYGLQYPFIQNTGSFFEFC